MSENARLKSKTIAGMFWKIMERVCAQLVSFAVSMLLARRLSLDEYGLISIVMIFLAIADVFVTSGFSAALVQKKDADDLDYSTLFYCSLVISIIIYILLYICAPLIAEYYHNDILIAIVRILSLRLPLSVFNSVQHAYVSSNLLFKKFFLSTLFGVSISGIVGLVMAYKGFGVWSLVAQYLINIIIDSIVLFITIPWRPKLMFSWDRAKTLMSFGSKVLLSTLSGTVFYHLRGMVIGKKYTTADLAAYNRGQQFSDLFTANISTSILTVMFPSLSKVGDDREKVKNMTRKAFQVLAFVMFPILIGLCVCAEPIVMVLLTDKWIPCIPYVQILSIFSAINVIAALPLETFKAMGRSDINLKLEFIKKPVFLVLLFIGVKYGVLWIAITLAIYALFEYIINMIYLRGLIDYSPTEHVYDIAGAIICTLVMSVVYFLNISDVMIIKLFTKVIAGVLLYVISAMVIKPAGYQYLKQLLSEKMKGLGK